MVNEFELDALTYYYHGRGNHYEAMQGGFIVGHSLLTAKPYSFAPGKEI